MAVPKTRGSSRRAYLWPLGFILLCFVCYLGSSIIVFDLFSPGLAHDVEHVSGIPAALGPKPRAWATAPAYYDTFYVGSEWPFQLYRPICVVWCKLQGYYYVRR